MLSLSHRQLLDKTVAVKLASGEIASPVAFVDFAWPKNFASFHLELQDIRISVEDTLAFAFSYDGVTFVNDDVNFDSYDGVGVQVGISNLSSTHTANPPNTPMFGPDGLPGFLPAVAGLIPFSVTMDIFPGNSNALATASGRATSSNQNQVWLLDWWVYLNPFAIVPPTPRRISAIRLCPFGNDDANPPTSGHTFTVGSYTLSGIVP